jgi:hypothetical protein
MVFTCGVTPGLIGGRWPDRRVLRPHRRSYRRAEQLDDQTNRPGQAGNDNLKLIRNRQFSAQVHTEIAYD